MITTEVRHGYTLPEIDILVRRGILRNPWYQAIDMDERYAAGWHAAVELLYTSQSAPAPRDLVNIAWNAADCITKRSTEARGVPRKRGDSYVGRDDMPRFHAYWFKRVHGAVDEPVVERLALGQIWPLLRPEYREALAALAAHEDYRAAAASLGLQHKTFYHRVFCARRQFIELWLEGETPGPRWPDRRGRPDVRQKSISARIKRRARDKAAAQSRLNPPPEDAQATSPPADADTRQ